MLRVEIDFWPKLSMPQLLLGKNIRKGIVRCICHSLTHSQCAETVAKTPWGYLLGQQLTAGIYGAALLEILFLFPSTGFVDIKPDQKLPFLPFELCSNCG